MCLYIPLTLYTSGVLPRNLLGGCVLGGVNSHIKAFKFHLFCKQTGNCSLKALKFKHLLSMNIAGRLGS